MSVVVAEAMSAPLASLINDDKTNDVPVAAPITGVVSVGVPASTTEPEPVEALPSSVMVPEASGAVTVRVCPDVIPDNSNCSCLVASPLSCRVKTLSATVDGPVAPVPPVVPVAPVTPVAPAGPVDPVGPEAPVSPVLE